jgi:energy-coupling factor transporter ATP-binding protein EcfA2
MNSEHANTNGDGLEFAVSPSVNGSVWRQVCVKASGQVLHCDRFDVWKANSRAQFLETVAKKAGRPVEELVERYDTLLVELAERADAAADAEADAQATERETDPFAIGKRELENTPADVLEAAKQMASNPQLLEIVYEDLQWLGLEGEYETALTVWLIGVSRVLETPMSAVVVGPSSTGKSYILNTVAKLFPPESVLKVSDATANSWYYLPAGSLRHRFVIMGERAQSETPEAIDSRKAWRELLADGELTKIVAEKTGYGVITRRIHQPGPVAYVESTTRARIFDEDQTRMLILQTDETETQTRRVVIRLFRDAIEPTSEQKLAEITAKHWAYQRMLGQCRVVIPETLGVRLAGAMPHSRPECRRLVRQVIAMMKASAVAHQFQRERRDDCIVASKRDYEITYRLLATAAAVQLGKQPHQAYQRLFEKLRHCYGSNEFTTADALELAGMSRRWTYNALTWFASNNIAERLTPGRGSRAASWRLVANEIRTQNVLPNPSEIADA